MEVSYSITAPVRIAVQLPLNHSCFQFGWTGVINQINTIKQNKIIPVINPKVIPVLANNLFSFFFLKAIIPSTIDAGILITTKYTASIKNWVVS